MVIKKQYYAIHKDGKVQLHGSSEGVTIGVGKDNDYAEFDTEAEMTAYISDNNLELPEVENG